VEILVLHEAGVHIQEDDRVYDGGGHFILEDLLLTFRPERLLIALQVELKQVLDEGGKVLHVARLLVEVQQGKVEALEGQGKHRLELLLLNLSQFQLEEVRAQVSDDPAGDGCAFSLL